MAESFILSIDQGTTSSRVIIFDKSGAIRGSAQREFSQFFPQPGWVEHDAQEIWLVTLDVIKEAMANTRIASEGIHAIGIANQRETTVLWDRQTGQPVAPAIVWQDRRTAAICDSLRERGFGETIANKTGLVIDPYFSGTKVQWLLENVTGLRDRAEHGQIAFGTIDSWLLWNLTGGKVHLTDYSNASRTLLFNIHTLTWDSQLLELLHIPASILPQVVSSSTIHGETDPALFDGVRIPIAGIAGDQQAALFGQACFSVGQAKNTYGTGSFLLSNIGPRPVTSKHKLLTTIAWRLGDRPVEYALEGSIFITGAAIQWLRDGLGIISTAPESESLAASVPTNDGVYFVPAMAGLGAPYWDPYARGTIVGITRGTTRAHLARAALEAIAYQTRDVAQAMQADSGVELTELRGDGGATANALLMQFQADILGVPVEVPAVAETTALGAAYLAGLATGFWKSTEELIANWRRGKAYEPQMPKPERERLFNQWHRAVERSTHWASPSQPRDD